MGRAPGRTSGGARGGRGGGWGDAPRSTDRPGACTRRCTRSPRPGPEPARPACRRPRPASACPPPDPPGLRHGTDSHVLLRDEGAVEAGHVLPVHLRILAQRVDRFLVPGLGRAMPLDVLVATLAV